MLPDEEKQAKIALSLYKDYFGLCDLYTAIAVKMLDNYNTKFEESEFSYRYVTLGLYVKACKTFRSIQVLCGRSLGEDANALLRVLLECCISTFYILINKKINAAFYVERQMMNLKHYKKILSDNKELRKTFHIPEEVAARVDEMCRIIEKRKGMGSYLFKLKQKLNKKLGRYKSKANTWSGVSLQQMAYKAGLRNEYDLLNSLTSQSIHAEDLKDHIALKENEFFGLYLIPGDKVVQTALPASIIIFSKILNKVNEEFNLKYGREIDKLDKEYERIAALKRK